MKMELREMQVDIQSNDNLVVEGIVNKPGELSKVLYSRGKRFREVVKKGVFQKAIDNATNIDYLAGHDSKQILASTSNGTLEIEETDEGVTMRANIVDTSYGRDAYALIKSGIIGHMSFGFRVKKNTWSTCEDGIPLRTIEDLELFEVSSLRNPAYDQSTISARGIEIEDVEVEIVEEQENRQEPIEFSMEFRDGEEIGKIEVRGAEEESVDLFLYGAISNSEMEKMFSFEPVVIPQDLLSILDSIKDTPVVNIHINSEGGSVFGGVAIYNILKGLKGKKIVYVDGIAASIASLIAMAGDEIHVNGALMVHKPSVTISGNADELRKMVDTLDVIQDIILGAYMSKAKEGVTEKDINKLINKSTWLTGLEASKYLNVIPSYVGESSNEESSEVVAEEKEVVNEVEESKDTETEVSNEDISNEEKSESVDEEETTQPVDEVINETTEEIREEQVEETEETEEEVEEEATEEVKEENNEETQELVDKVDELRKMMAQLEESKYKIEEE